MLKGRVKYVAKVDREPRFECELAILSCITFLQMKYSIYVLVSSPIKWKYKYFLSQKSLKILLNKLIIFKYLEYCLVHCNCSVRVSYYSFFCGSLKLHIIKFLFFFLKNGG